LGVLRAPSAEAAEAAWSIGAWCVRLDWYEKSRESIIQFYLLFEIWPASFREDGNGLSKGICYGG
jgi:hypothetical protein